MGAHDISFELNKKATPNQIQTAFKEQRESDANENGHQSGYSGDFQTVHSVDLGHLGKVFPSQHDAMEFCLDKAKKWDTVVAVYYNANRQLPKHVEAKLERINVKYKALSVELEAAKRTQLDAPKEFKTCPNCKSRLAMKYVDVVHLGMRCPLCDLDWKPKRLQAKIAKLNTKLTALKSEAQTLANAERAKLAEKAKASDIRTLIAGWGAS